MTMRPLMQIFWGSTFRKTDLQASHKEKLAQARQRFADAMGVFAHAAGLGAPSATEFHSTIAHGRWDDVRAKWLLGASGPQVVAIFLTDWTLRPDSACASDMVRCGRILRAVLADEEGPQS